VLSYSGPAPLRSDIWHPALKEATSRERAFFSSIFLPSLDSVRKIVSFTKHDSSGIHSHSDLILFSMSWFRLVWVSVLLVSWSVICFQDSCFMVRQRRIAKEYLSHNLDKHCLVCGCKLMRLSGLLTQSQSQVP